MNRDQGRLGTKHRMAGNQGSAASFIADGVSAVFGLHLEDRAGQDIPKVDSTLDFGPYDVAIYRIAEVRARFKQLRLWKVRRRLHNSIYPDYAIIAEGGNPRGVAGPDILGVSAECWTR